MSKNYTSQTAALKTVIHDTTILNAKKIVSDNIKTTDGETYITKETADELYNGDNISGYDYTPAQEQKIQFSLNDSYNAMMNGWLVMNPDNISEDLTISVNDRPMFHSDSDGNVSFQILVKGGDTITSTATSSRNAYFMPCMSELEDWREESLKSDTVDIWKNAVVTGADGNINVRDQWLENSSSSNWRDTHGYTYASSLKYIENDEAFDASGNHLFYIQTENIRTGFIMFSYFTSLESFNGDLSNLTDGYAMFYNSALESFDGDLSNLENGSKMFSYSALESFNGDLSSLTTINDMFHYCSNLVSFNGDLSSLTDGSNMFYYCSNLASFNGDLSSLTDGSSMFYDTALASFDGDLSSLTNGGGMFGSSLKSFNGDLSSLTSANGIFGYCSNLASFNGDLSSLTDGSSMFYMTALKSFIGDLPNLTNGYWMFAGAKITSWDIDLPSLTNGTNMFYATTLKSFNIDLPNLTNGYQMFYGSTLKSFSGDLKKLTNGNRMFNYCSSFTSFSGDLRSLTNGSDMFAGCKLDLASVQNIANTIKTVTSGSLYLGIQSSLQGTADLTTALSTIEGKGWTIGTSYN